MALRMVPWDTMIIMISIINNIFDRLATRANRLARINKVMMIWQSGKMSEITRMGEWEFRRKNLKKLLIMGKGMVAPVWLARRVLPWGTMTIMNGFIDDIFDRLAPRAGRLDKIWLMGRMSKTNRSGGFILIKQPGL